MGKNPKHLQEVIDRLTDALSQGRPIADVLVDGRARRPGDAEARLARHGDAPLPVGIEQRLAEALTGEPTLPDGIEARLDRAL